MSVKGIVILLSLFLSNVFLWLIHYGQTAEQERYKQRFEAVESWFLWQSNPNQAYWDHILEVATRTGELPAEMFNPELIRQHRDKEPSHDRERR